MNNPLGFEAYLSAAVARAPELEPVCATVRALADAGRQIAAVLARGPLAGNLSAIMGASIDGDGQKKLDAMTHEIVRTALLASPVAVYASEEAQLPELLNKNAPLVVAVDPLDGSSNIDTLAPVGTIFSILPAGANVAQDPGSAFLQAGRAQLAAGFLIYGPQTALVLTLGDGTRIFTLDPETNEFTATKGDVVVPPATKEYAINSSNFYHWDAAVSSYVVELMQGENGPRGQNFNTRWLASMVGDAYRILMRGGIYLYPADQRPGYSSGRLRLVYEANPIALLMQQAGASATDGLLPILDLVPTDIHQRCPLIFGSALEVARVTKAMTAKAPTETPLFKQRSLYRAAPQALKFIA